MRTRSITHAPIASVATLAAMFCAGCTGNIITPVPPGPNPAAMACPALDTTMNIPIAAGGCAGVRLTNVNLTCAGGALSTSLSTTPGGATRIDGTLADGSVFTATATPVDGRCFDGIPVNIGITIGLRYVGEQGQEITGPTTGSACIVRSRATYTQYVTTDPVLVHPGVEEFLKGKLHERLDRSVVAGRCLRWREL